MEKMKWVLGVVGVSVVVVIVMVMGMSRLGDAGTRTYGEEALVTGARWIKENGEVKVTVVEFSDIQCPACQVAEKEAKKIRDMEGVRFVYRHFPLTNIHKNAVSAAIAVEVARDMGKGWEMLEKLFEKQNEWSGLDVDSVRKYFVTMAKDMSFDEKVYEQKYGNVAYRRLVEDESLVPLRLQLSGTPTFFVNGVKTDLSQLEKVVKNALGK